MLAFHNDQAIKDKYLTRVRLHREADEIIKGTYWEDGKGCAVGCTIHSGEHKAYETELGIPQWLARVEDRLFEGMPNKDAKLWPERFLDAIKPGVDLEKVKAPFLIYVLRSALTTFDHDKYPKSKKAIDDVIQLYESGEIDLDKFREARDAAYAAAAYAAYAAAYAADAAAYAAYAAAYAAAAYAADAAAYAAAAYAADAAARRKKYKEFADKLIEIMEGLG
jgi:hypothetical protein